MLASRDGHTNIVQLLLEHGADANLRNKVSSCAKIVCCVCVCLTAVHLAYSTTIIVLCGDIIDVQCKEKQTTNNKQKLHKNKEEK